jgi:hypothetical protein
VRYVGARWRRVRRCRCSVSPWSAPSSQALTGMLCGRGSPRNRGRARTALRGQTRVLAPIGVLALRSARARAPAEGERERGMRLAGEEPLRSRVRRSAAHSRRRMPGSGAQGECSRLRRRRGAARPHSSARANRQLAREGALPPRRSDARTGLAPSLATTNSSSTRHAKLERGTRGGRRAGPERAAASTRRVEPVAWYYLGLALAKAAARPPHARAA